MRVDLVAGAAAVLFLSAASAQTLYRCTGADGKVAYQDRPCASGAQQDKQQINVAPVDPAARRAAQARAARDRMTVEQIERRERLETLERQAHQDRAALRERIDKSGQNYKAERCASIERMMQWHEDNMREGRSVRGMEWNRREFNAERSRFDRECR